MIKKVRGESNHSMLDILGPTVIKTLMYSLTSAKFWCLYLLIYCLGVWLLDSYGVYSESNMAFLMANFGFSDSILVDFFGLVLSGLEIFGTLVLLWLCVIH